MSYTPYPSDTESMITIDGTRRVAQSFTLFDGKILDAENTLKWSTVGTGAATYSNNSIALAVTSGQYSVRQGKVFTPYFSGKPQRIEATCFNFHNEANVTKRIGYFSSNAVAPYASTLDGIYLESDGSTHRLVCSNSGTITHNVPETSWDNYDEVVGYDWSKFTVISIDFLWLGGVGVRLFMVIDGVFKLIHTIKDHAGFASTLICKYPQQPVRYEIRSTTGTGSLTAVCSQVSSEGSVSEQGEGVAIYSINKSTNVVGTNYLVCAARKTAANRYRHITLDRTSLGITGTTADSGIILLCVNPTYSATPTWVTNGRLEQTTPTTDITVTNLGRVIQAFPLVDSASVASAPQAALRTLTSNLDDTFGELALVYQPTTANQVVSGSMILFEY